MTPDENDKPARTKVGGLRALGSAARRPEPAPSAPAADPELAAAARALIAEEFERAFAMKEKLAEESGVGATEKGRDVERPAEKMRGVVASLEGMSKFAMKMGLLTAAESREMFADAMKRGLYEGWR